MRSVIAVDATVRRLLVVLLVLLPIGVAFSVRRGDSLSTTMGHALVGVGVFAFFIGCYLWARRKD